MKPRGLHEVESDIQKTFFKLRAACECLEPDAENWRSVMTLCERLHEEAGRAFAIAKQAESLNAIRRSQPYGLQE